MMAFVSRVSLMLVLCMALVTMACASDTADEASQTAKEPEPTLMKPAESTEPTEETQATEVEASSKMDTEPATSHPRAKNAAYDFTLKGTDGSYLRLSDYTGKVVLLNFWDTWCAPCRMEIPDLKELHSRYSQDGFVVIGIALGRNGEQKVRSFVQQSGINYPVVIASREMLSAYGGVASIPTTFLLDRDQTIHKRYIGLQRKATLEQEIKGLLAQG
jgi:peroxiredoxin